MLDLRELKPPEPDVTPELVWVLRAAFALEAPTPPANLDSGLVTSQARDLAVTERIGARHDLGELTAELHGPFQASRARAAAIGLHYERLAREVAEVASGLETPVVFLKGLALVLAGWSDPGARSFSDLDILVPEERAHDLFNALVGRKFRPARAEPTEQHLPELAPPGGGSLEVHFALRGIQVNGRFAGYDDLAERNALTHLGDLPGSSHLPSRPLAAAHVLAHGFQQHLLRPATYPLFRMIADLLDLLPRDADWDALGREWHPTIEHAVTTDSFEATRQLCELLRLGMLPDRRAHPDAETLFRHLVAGVLDPGYSRSLRGIYLRKRTADAYRRGELAGYLKRKIRPLFHR